MGNIIKIALGVALLLGLAGFAMFSRTQQPSVVSYTKEPDGQPPLFIARPIDGYRLYKNQLLRFSLQYPEDFKVREYGAANTSTIVFEDPKGEKGFQIFVVPYSGDTITPERLKMDIPSGVIRDSKQVVIDGVTATMFFSVNTAMGDTREVWFIHGGFLYEVTTYKDLDLWLGGIMQRWEFL